MKLALAGLLMLGGCALSSEVTYGLPDVHAAGPMATSILEGRQPAHAWPSAGWLLAYEASGHFEGYSPAQKVYAARLRASGQVCADDRDMRYRVFHRSSGIYGYSEYQRIVPCQTGYIDWPKPEAFGAASVAELTAAARNLGMQCSEHSLGADCLVVAELYSAPKPGETTRPTRTARLTLRAGAPPTMVIEGAEQ